MVGTQVEKKNLLLSKLFLSLNWSFFTLMNNVIVAHVAQVVAYFASEQKVPSSILGKVFHLTY